MATFLEIHSPKPPTQCVPTTFSWDGGVAPYTLKITSVTRESQIGDVLQTFSGIRDQSLQWPVNLVGGTVFGIVLSDSTPITVQFEPVTVQPGPDSGCLGDSSTTGEVSSTSRAPTTSAAAATSSSSDPSSVGTTSAVASGSTFGGATAISTSSPTSTSGAPTGVAGDVTAHASKSLGSGVVAGIAISAALAGILFAVLVYWLWRRYGRRRMGSPRSLDLNESTLPPVQPPRTSKIAEAGAMRQSPIYDSPLSSPSHTAGSFPHYPSGVSNGYTDPSVYTPTPRTSQTLTPRTSRTRSASRHSSALLPRDGRLSIVNSSNEGTSTARSSKVEEAQSLSTQVVSWAPSTFHQSVQESDAGVRLAGGFPLPPIVVTEASEGGSLREIAPVPPPYRRYDE